VERERLFAATPEQLFGLIADVDELARILPRVERVEVLERGAGQARLRTHMAIGPFGSFESEGVARWVENRELTFSTSRPAAVATRWTLAPADGGTLLRVTMALDLTPLLGPLAGLVPAESVRAVIAPDLEAALSALAERVGAAPR
jgi:ribosome-associated toxin RatA of RatAB toxin-antitoxin module